MTLHAAHTNRHVTRHGNRVHAWDARTFMPVPPSSLSLSSLHTPNRVGSSSVTSASTSRKPASASTSSIPALPLNTRQVLKSTIASCRVEHRKQDSVELEKVCLRRLCYLQAVLFDGHGQPDQAHLFAARRLLLDTFQDVGQHPGNVAVAAPVHPADATVEL